MDSSFERTAMLLGENALKRLESSSVIVFGVGGVGSHAAEALARCGVGRIALVDSDVVAASNINRQIIALTSTIGRKKTEVMAERMRDINPRCDVLEYPVFYEADTADLIPLKSFDYAIDAIDTVSSKLLLIESAKRLGIPIISCMGAGNKLDPSLFKIDDITKTTVCPLARVMRRELKKRGIFGLKVLYSTEKTDNVSTMSMNGRNVPGSVSFVPPVAGFMIAGEVIRDIAGLNKAADL